MAEHSGQRRLAAVLAADIAGYARLMEADEHATVAAWKAARVDVIDPKIAAFSGRIVKHTGDGFLAEFGAVADAVDCAIEMQKSLTAQADDAPADRRMLFRMGINLGDVIEELDDIHGDGVNIAARLESLAEPGGICVSGSVFDQVRKNAGLAFDDLGRQTVKNIAQPVRVYRLHGDGMAPRPAGGISGRLYVAAFAAAALVMVAAAVVVALWRPWEPEFQPVKAEEMALPLPDKPSIAVLPFANISGDKDQEYFADGITEDIITDLSKISGLFVIARTSTLRYKGKEVDVRQVARDLGVAHILEGSVRKSGDRIRITAQLIDALSGAHMWAERYDRDFADVFAVQDDVAGKIVANLAVTLTPEEKERAVRKRRPKPDAYDLYLRGAAIYLPPSPANLKTAEALFDKAIALDPDFAGPYASISLIHFLRVATGQGETPDKEIAAATRFAEKAIAVDDGEETGYRSLAFAYLYGRRFDEALAAIEHALALAPGDASVLGGYAQILQFSGEPEKAIEYAKRAMRASPADIRFSYFLGAAYRAAGQYDKAIQVLELRQQRLGRPDFNPELHLIAAYMQSGHAADARARVRTFLKFHPRFNMRTARLGAPYKRPEDLDTFLDAIRKAGLPDE